MKWTLQKAEWFVRLEDRAGKYRHTAVWIANLIGCTKASVQSMRRKALRLERLGVVSDDRLARLLLVPDGIVLTRSLKAIEAHSLLDVVQVRQFVRRARVTGKRHLVGTYKRNIAVNAAEVTA